MSIFSGDKMKKFIVATIFTIVSVMTFVAVASADHQGLDFEMRIDQDAYYMDCEYVKVTVELVADNYPQTINIVIQNSILSRRRGPGDVFRQELTFNGAGLLSWGGPQIPSFWRQWEEIYEVRVTSSEGEREEVTTFRAVPIPYFFKCK